MSIVLWRKDEKRTSRVRGLLVLHCCSCLNVKLGPTLLYVWMLASRRNTTSKFVSHPASTLVQCSFQKRTLSTWKTTSTVSVPLDLPIKGKNQAPRPMIQH